MAELLDEFINLGILQENEENSYKNILFRLSLQRKLYTAAIIVSSEGSIIMHIYDGHLFEFEGIPYCISEWKYRDLEDPTSNLTEAVWEKTSPWILKCDYDMQFMCKTLHTFKIAVSGECQILSWTSAGIQEIGFTIEEINEAILYVLSEEKSSQKLCNLAIEVLNRGLVD